MNSRDSATGTWSAASTIGPLVYGRRTSALPLDDVLALYGPASVQPEPEQPVTAHRPILALVEEAPGS